MRRLLAGIIRALCCATLIGFLALPILVPGLTPLLLALPLLAVTWWALLEGADRLERPKRRPRTQGGSLTDYIENAILDRVEIGGDPSYPTAFDGLPDAVKGPLLIARGAYVTSDAPDAIVDYEARVAEILASTPSDRKQEIARLNRTAGDFKERSECRTCEVVYMHGSTAPQDFVCSGRCHATIYAASGEVIFPGETVTDRTLDLDDEGV